MPPSLAAESDAAERRCYAPPTIHAPSSASTFRGKPPDEALPAAPSAGADPHPAAGQPDRLRRRASDPRRRDRSDAGAERHRVGAGPRAAGGHARARSAVPGAVRALARRRAARRPRPLDLGERAGQRADRRASSGESRTRLPGAAGGGFGGRADRGLVGALPGQAQRLRGAVVLARSAVGAGLLAGHAGDGLSFGLVALGSRTSSTRRCSRTRCATSRT